MRNYIEPFITADKILELFSTVRTRMSEQEIGQALKLNGCEPNNIRAGWKQLVKDGYFEIDGTLNDWFIRTGEGADFTQNGGYEKYFERLNAAEIKEQDIKDITNEKIKVDLANAKRIYKTYWSTRTLAIIGAASGLAAILLKVAELLGWLPLKK